jgi:ornithine cyclodeaminase
MSAQVSVPLEPLDSPEAICAEADVIACTTRSQKPLFVSKVIRPGTHIGVAGPLRKDGQEIPLDLVRDNYLFVDRADKFLSLWEPGTAPIVEAELGKVMLGEAQGRIQEDAITIFKPVGMAFEDVVSASVILRNLSECSQEYKVSW